MKFLTRTEIFAKHLSFPGEGHISMLFTGYFTEQQQQKNPECSMYLVFEFTYYLARMSY